MDDLISRQEAINRIESLTRTCGGDDGVCPLTETDKVFNYAVEVAASCIYNLPTAQPEIIRCKDCKHYQEDHLFRIGFCDGRQRNNDDFCSHAERGKDE